MGGALQMAFFQTGVEVGAGFQATATWADSVVTNEDWLAFSVSDCRHTLPSKASFTPAGALTFQWFAGRRAVTGATTEGGDCGAGLAARLPNSTPAMEAPTLISAPTMAVATYWRRRGEEFSGPMIFISSSCVRSDFDPLAG